MAAYNRVLAGQDPTLLNDTHHPMTHGLGPIGTPEQDLPGLVMHSPLGHSGQGLPLGLATQAIWARAETEEEEEPPPQKKKPQKARPIEEKESFKWIVALRGTVAVTPPGVEVVTVCDREADADEFFQEAAELGTDVLGRAT
jgi:hypothetical protein